MALAKVWNDHKDVYVEKFRDEEIKIPAGKFVEMDKFDAMQFVGQYTPVIKDGLGNDLRPKMLRVEVAPDKEVKPVEYTCQACKGKFDTEKELVLHSDAFHKDVQIKDAKK